MKLQSHYYRLIIIPTKQGAERARAICECTNIPAQVSAWSDTATSHITTQSIDFKVRAREYLDDTCKTGSHTLLTEELHEAEF